jgi:hypothetical protein
VREHVVRQQPHQVVVAPRLFRFRLPVACHQA